MLFSSARVFDRRIDNVGHSTTVFGRRSTDGFRSIVVQGPALARDCHDYHRGDHTKLISTSMICSSIELRQASS
jgi:hypothetical protein